MKLKRIITYSFMFAISIGSLIGCVSLPDNTDFLPVGSPTSFSIPSATATLSPVLVAATMVANTDYNRGCPAINFNRQSVQLGYRGVFPGETKSQVEVAFGSPLEIGTITLEMWGYDRFGVQFINDKVYDIYVEEDSTILVSVDAIVNKYGCPNLIIAIDSKEEPTGGYNITHFVYYDLGVEFLFYKFQVSMFEIAASATFFKVRTLEEYMKYSWYGDVHSDAAKPVTWFDAVK